MSLLKAMATAILNHAAKHDGHAPETWCIEEDAVGPLAKEYWGIGQYVAGAFDMPPPEELHALATVSNFDLMEHKIRMGRAMICGVPIRVLAKYP